MLQTEQKSSEIRKFELPILSLKKKIKWIIKNREMRHNKDAIIIYALLRHKYSELQK